MVRRRQDMADPYQAQVISESPGYVARSILAWKLQLAMTSDSLIQVVQIAIDATGMTEVPLADRTAE